MSTELMSQFLEHIHASRLLDNDRIDELLRRPEPPQGDVEGVERFLEGKGWLTRFQIDEVRQGRGAQLVFNGYTLVEKIEDHPGGVVYKAKHPALLEPVAFKWLNAAWLEPSDRVGDFLQRAQNVSLVSHQHLMNVLDAGQSGGKLFLVCEYVDSTDLGRLVNDMGAVPVALACEYIRQATLGLQALHERQLAHGDFSPYRMLLWPVVRKAGGNGSRKAGSVRPGPGAMLKVAEVGQIPLRPALSEMTFGDTAKMGAIDFMAPERVSRSGHDVRGDVYSVGASLYYLLAARPPFNSTTPAETLSNLQNAEPVRIDSLRNDLPPALADLIHRMLAKDPHRRPANAGEVAAVLQQYCALSTPAPKPARQPIPTASETLSLPQLMVNQTGQASALEEDALPIAEALPDVEPLPDTVRDSQVYSPRNPAPVVESHEEPEHHDPFGGHHDDYESSEPRRPKKESADAGKSMLLIGMGICLHLSAVLLILWYLEIWPFNKAEVPPPPETKHEEKPPKKPKKQTSALEGRFLPGLERFDRG